ncbi:radical SAM family heme chaperone HemW [Marinimicrobium alkaliphilum]|uniref:radical SAM family heme chaperone HemW n=1 Tax=Marinimicrobium alkaliphilum TaxID=2202654 RepID=UPI000DB96BA2|nr:radical SAM family heme chaperone HemW [Marinimicrobium alkaliphilum]
MTLTLPPLSLYVHIPWCVRKCPYCDFNSHEAESELPEDAYVDALLRDLALDQSLAQGRKLTSIFFGGGTPSLFSAPAIGRILDGAERLIGFEPAIEITLEANPGTFEQARFTDYRRAGVNRLSIGIQSFNSTQLAHLGRIHSGAEALKAVDMARQAGFDNINLDLMHGLPEQRISDACADLRQALDLAPEHLSWYQLTIEQNTAFYRQPPVLPEEDTLAEIQDAGQALLSYAGYRQYEVSAYARHGRQARHNLNYWTFGDYLGIGAGAHGKVTRPHHYDILRLWKTRLPRHYLGAEQRVSANLPGHNNPFAAGGQTLSEKDRVLEFLLNALRLNEGAPVHDFTARTGLAVADLEPQWARLRAQGLVLPPLEQLRTTPLGHRFLNTVLEAFSD